MIRKYIEDQLKRCNFANLNNFKPESGTFIIPKYSKPKYDLNKCYLVKVSSSIVNNPASVTATNWNAGGYPRVPYLKAVVSKTMGKMVYLDCLEYDYENKQDLTTMWSGWLSIDDLTQITELQ